MELRHLRYFIAVAEEENVTRAAERLHVSQPPLSRQIRDLEDELGVALFERTAKAIRLTEAGRLFLGEARAVVERATQAVNAVKALGTGLTGKLEVGFAPSLAVDILPRALRKLQAEAPGMRVNLHDLSTEEMLAGLRKSTIDVALMVQVSPQSLRGLQSVEIQRYGICAVVSPAHPLARRKKVGLKDLAGERMIGYSREDYPEFLQWFNQLAWPNKRIPQIAEAHDSVTSLIAAVEAGRGIAIAPETIACLTGPRLTLVPLSPQPAPFAVIAAWCEGTGKVKRFVAAAEAR